MINLKEALSEIEREIKHLPYPEYPASLYEPVSYIMSLGGKRIRPLCVLMSCDLFSGDWKNSMPSALALEIFHNFTLVHDDIMDQASMRRGKQTIHHKWNVNAAILSGDVMQVLAYQKLLETQTKDIRTLLEIFTEVSKAVCEGQQLDMDFEKQDQVEHDQYMHMIGLKTACLLAGSFKIGSFLGGASEKDMDLMYEFGYNMGLAFQIQDDILDSFGNEDKFGKKVGGDILCGKKTILAIHAAKHSGAKGFKILKQAANNSDNPQIRVKEVLDLYTETGALQFAKSRMDYYHHAALDCIAKVDAVRIRKELVKDFFVEMLEREK